MGEETKSKPKRDSLTVVNGAPKEGPVFDWDNMSYGDSEQASMAAARIRHSLTANDSEGLGEAFTAMRELMAAVLVSVPRSWLVSSAPPDAEINWHDPEDIRRWVKASKSQALGEAYADPGAASGE